MEKVKELLGYVPGYRSGVKWKMAIATLYYLFGLLGLLAEPSDGAFLLATPIIIFGIIEILKGKKNNISPKKTGKPFAIILLVIFFAGALLPGAETDDTGNGEEELAIEESEDGDEEDEVASVDEDSEDKQDSDSESKDSDEEKDTDEEEQAKEEDQDKEDEEEQASSEEKTVNTEGQVEVHFIDVGQGDAIYIKTPGKNILIDGGNRGSTALNYLRNQGVSHLDLMIGTHPHADHIGGLINVMEGMTVSEVIDPGVTHTSKTFEDYLTLIDEKDIRFTEGRVRMTQDLGGGATMEVLHPRSPSSRHLNDASVVVRITFGNVSFLLTGDAEQAAEREMLNRGGNLQSTILKVGHHGSNTSTTQAFLNAVNPKEAVFMVGNNSYGHPTPETVSRLESAGVNIHRMDQDGTVVFVTDGTSYSVNGSSHSVTEGSSTSTQPRAKDEGPDEEDKTKKAPEKSEESSDEKVNINTATIEELQEIIHIGPAFAQRIIDLRPFNSLDNLDRVQGIGPTRLSDIKDEGKAYVD